MTTKVINNSQQQKKLFANFIYVKDNKNCPSKHIFLNWMVF